MAKISQYIVLLFVSVFLTFTSCLEDNYKLGELIAPSNVTLSYEVAGVDAENPFGDGSGIVNFTATAENVITFNYEFGDGKDNKIAPDGKVTHQFSRAGINTYNVTVMAVGTGGIISSKTVQVEVFSSFTDDEALEFLTGGGTKTWYWAADQPGHAGLGPNFVDGTNHTYAAWYAAAPYEKSETCMYDDEFVFSKADGELKFERINPSGGAFIPGTYAGKLGIQGDICHTGVIDISGVKNVSFAPASSIATADGGYRGTTMSFSDGGFLGWYVGKNECEIIQVTDNILRVRIEEDETFAWYHTFTSVKPGSEEELDVTYSDLVWADEFDTDGSPNASRWTYDLGTGDNGWGNGEVQSYTDNTENVSIADGILKITAKKEGSGYTSARIKTQGLYDFTYGRVDVRAKLPEGGGTWPAIWLLGSSFTSIGWPACGEIDIMEAVGNNPGHVQAAIHTPSSHGATVNTGSKPVPDASSEFHVYSVNWSPNQITFLVDDEIYYTYKPETKNDDTWPFNAPHFIILNVAMGGTLGGNIDPNFTQSSMEIDYVRVYQ